jgi:hypothetical protein
LFVPLGGFRDKAEIDIRSRRRRCALAGLVPATGRAGARAAMTDRMSMSTTRAIDDLVERLVGDILNILERARDEHRARALDTVAALLATTPQARPVRAQPARPTAPVAKKPTPARAANKAPSAPARPPTPTREVRTPPPAAPRRPEPPPKRERARVKPLAAAVVPAVEATQPPPERADAGPSATERETAVLDAVRVLVRATAAEVAERCGLPNGTVYVVLRSLCASRRVAKTETPRGLEYSLVSTGGIQPFKRSKPAAPAEAPAPAETNVA